MTLKHGNLAEQKWLEPREFAYLLLIGRHANRQFFGFRNIQFFDALRANIIAILERIFSVNERRLPFWKLEKWPTAYLMSCNSPNEKSCRFYQEITATTGLLLCKCLQLSQQECWLAGINCVVINLVSGRGGKCFVDSTVGVAASWGQNMNNLFLSFRSFGFCVCVAVLPLWPSLIGCQADNPMAMRLWPRNVLFFLLKNLRVHFFEIFRLKFFKI